MHSYVHCLLPLWSLHPVWGHKFASARRLGPPITEADARALTPAEADCASNLRTTLLGVCNRHLLLLAG